MKRTTSRLVSRRLLLPFILVTSLFFAWGFANDITNPMVKAFSKIFRMSVTDGALVQLAFYGGYFAMAFPAALLISRYTYKSGIIVGLALYAAGALLFIPASMTGLYYPFLVAYFVLTCGLSFLETTANPYILSMGDERTATRRLNLAQAFNPMGSLLGMFAAKQFIVARMNPLDTGGRAALPDAEFEAVKAADLEVLVTPYVAVGLAVLVLLAIVRLARMPGKGDEERPGRARDVLRRVLAIPRYREGVIAQFFYVGVQIMAWTFIIQYGTRVFMNEGMSEQAAEIRSQDYNIAAMVIFCASRFACTFLLKFFSPGKLLMTLAVGGACLTAGVIGFQDVRGLYCLVAVSACMSLMFPTIYGIALGGLGADAKFAAAGLIMAILGGSVLPPLQAALIDRGTLLGMPAENASFILPLFCFLVITCYGYRARAAFKR
ncbi:MAG: L-fucose:H+ symporter permease [Odoribacteraceae bacterium]|nr:L-fucose:H+ symporter permease [Odoribacteraceae bacterium]